MMLSILKYLAWFLTNALAISGAWFVEFTEDSEDGRKKLTKWGKVGLPITIISCILALILTIVADVKEAQHAKSKEKETAELNQKMEKVLQLVSVLGQPESPATKEQFENIAEDPLIQEMASEDPNLRQALNQIESRIGGKPQLIRRLKTTNPNLNITPESIAIFASFSLRLYGAETSPETHNGVIRTIRGIEADVIALQEIKDTAALNRLMASLPEFEPIASFSDRLVNPILLFRKGRVMLIGEATSIDGPFARRPLVQKIQIGNTSLRFVNVHLKSRLSTSSDEQGRQRRTAEVEALARWVRDHQADGSIVLAGVFHAELNEPEMQPLHALGALFPTRELPASSTTYISRNYGPLKFSHFALFGPIRDNYVPQSIQVYDLVKLLPEMSERQITDSISDHNPISITVRVR